jgi:hypothetical protein
MIRVATQSSLQSLTDQSFDLFIYALGFETRATELVSVIGKAGKVFALRMPAVKVHAYDRNVKYAKTNKHRLIDNLEVFIQGELRTLLGKRKGPVHIGFDISSVNRIMLIEILNALAVLTGPEDCVELLYCPAAYIEPDWLFPQIERLGPVNGLLSGFNSDPSKPLCLVLGMGFEAGVSMGIISQLEPSVSVCLWGTGVDPQFDSAVKRANFEFDFPGFNTRVLKYNIGDPQGAYELLESIVYGLVREYRIIVVPMGPKLFTALAALVGMQYFGEVAVWRVQHSRVQPSDSVPSSTVVRVVLDPYQLAEYRTEIGKKFPAAAHVGDP